MKTRVTFLNTLSNKVRAGSALRTSSETALHDTSDQERYQTLMETTKGHVQQTLRSACAALALMALPFGSAVAQTTASEPVYLAGAERIEIGDRVRMYSQRITAMACMIDAGISPAENRAAIITAMAEVDTLLDAMKDGNSDLNVEIAEDDRRMLQAIRGVSLQWATFRDAMDLRLSVGADAVIGPDYVSRQNLNLMHASKYLISETVSRYSIPPALLQNDAFTLQIVARQRTLSQQIAKESCGILTGNAVMGNEVRLAKSTRRFDASLNALINGFEGAGVSAPATVEISDGLTAMTADWAALRAELEQVSASTDPAKAGALFTQLDSLLSQFERLVPLYVEESKSGL